MRLFELEAICENCLAKKSPKIALKKQQRESEEEDAEAGIAEQEEDRSGLVGARRRRRKFEGAAPLITVLRRSVGARQAVPRQT